MSKLLLMNLYVLRILSHGGHGNQVLIFAIKKIFRWT